MLVKNEASGLAMNLFAENSILDTKRFSLYKNQKPNVKHTHNPSSTKYDNKQILKVGASSIQGIASRQACI